MLSLINQQSNLIFNVCVCVCVCVCVLQEMTKSSLVHELAVCAGRCMFSVHCTPQMSHDIILNCIKGIAGTGELTNQ